MGARMISKLPTRFFMFCVLGIIWMKILSKFYMITIPVLHMFFVPQIVKNSIYGYKDSFSIFKFSVILESKLVIALYLAGCPKNFLRYEPLYHLCVNIGIILVAQAAILCYQRFRPRFLVPKKYRPMNYDYFRSKSEERIIAANSENICTICMTPLNVRGNVTESIVNKNKTMHAPCSHRFHQDCLLQWMAVKMECPTCRTGMPIF